MLALSAVSARPRSVALAFTLLDLLERASLVATELEEAAYDEYEYLLMYTARSVKESLEKSREGLLRALEARRGNK